MAIFRDEFVHFDSLDDVELTAGALGAVKITGGSGGVQISGNTDIKNHLVMRGDDDPNALPAENDLVKLMLPQPGNGRDLLRVVDPNWPTGGDKITITEVGSIYCSAFLTMTSSINGTNNLPTSDPERRTYWQHPSPQAYMVGIWADVPCALELRGPNASHPTSYLVSCLNTDGKQTGRVENNFDLSYVDEWTPTAPATSDSGLDNQTRREAATLFKWGRRGRRSLGPKGGALALEKYTVAGLNANTAPDAYAEGPGALIYVTDATTPGIYASNGYRWGLIHDPTTEVGPNSFGWTPNVCANSGSGGAITASGTGESAGKTFQKTGGGSASWNVSVYSSETLTGDQLVEGTIQSLSLNGALYMIGLVDMAPPFQTSHWKDMKYAAFAQGQYLFPAYSGTVGGACKALVDGDHVAVRMVGGTVTLEVNGTTVYTFAGTAPSSAYRVMATFNMQSSCVKELRWRPLA